MPIKAQSADGVVHEFPDETTPDVVDKAMKTYAEKNADKTTFLGQLGRGFMDPVEGGAQLLSHIVPKPVEEAINNANNWLADKTGLVAKLPAGGMDERVQEREKQIQSERGINKNNIDWARMGGDMLNPANYIGGGVTGGAGKIANLARAAFGGATAAAMQPVTEPEHFAASKSGQTILGGLFGVGIGAAGQAASKGAEAIGSYIARSHPEALENAAVRKIIQRIVQDNKAGGPGATEMLDLINESGKPMSLVDVGGANLRGLAGNVARQPGESKNIATAFLTKRDEAAAQRLSADIEKYVFSGQSAHQATEALLQARSAAGKPNYDAVHALKNVWSPRLEQFLQDPLVKQGLSRGYELERMVSLAEGRPLTATQMGVDIGIDGSVKMLDKPNMRLLDMAKQGLDAMIADERNEITGRLSARGVALDKMRRAYVDTIDNIDSSKTYKKARESWAGYSKSLDAVKQGRSVFQRSPEENEAAIKSLSPSEQEFYRLGTADLLRERLSKTGFSGDEAKSLVKNPWMRDQLRPIFNTKESFDRFVDAVTNESKMFGSRNAMLGGSQTAERLAEDTGGGEALLAGSKAAYRLAHWDFIGAARDAWKLYRDLGLKPNPELNEKISQILFSTPLDPKGRVGQKLTGALSSDLANPAQKTATGLSQFVVPSSQATAAVSQNPGTQ